ncbi:MAG: hypothetical protein RLZZ417_285 [Bacteroidota bacterium]|jgi:hypothetical protein
MDKEKARILINKINALYKNIDANSPGVSPLERDLMLSYLRQFYETIALSKTQPKPAISEEKKESIPLNVASVDEKIETSTLGGTNPIDLSKIIEKEIPKEDLTTGNHLVVEPIAPIPAEILPFAETVKPVYSGDLNSLFFWQEPSNLAEKLANQPLSSLSLTTFSMNERLLYENDLFRKNKSDMEEAIKMLNNFSHFDQAKTFLLQLGTQYDWHKEERKDAAKSFINTVRRRFL